MIATSGRPDRPPTTIVPSMIGTSSSSAAYRPSTSQSMRASGHVARSAAAAGSACTRSPSAPSRTMRMDRAIQEEVSRDTRSRVEWSFGSPTIAVRPPYDSTTGRSGTVSTV